MVYLSTTNLNMEQKTPKLKIIERIGKVAYKLELPNNIKIHPVVYVWKLRKHKDGQEGFLSRPNDGTHHHQI